MNHSTVPFLVLALLAFLPACAAVAARRLPERAPRMMPLVVLSLLLGIWVAVSSWASTTDLYDQEAFLRLLPGFWLPLVPMLIATFCYIASPTLRCTLTRTLNGTPRHWHVLFQALRLASAGAMYKAYQGEFPIYFAVFSGGPDFLYALSALWMSTRVKRGEISRTALIAWNIIGFAALALTAPLLLQLGLPGPLQVFTTAPLSDIILEFPMALAPTLTGPLFIMMNALWIKHLICEEDVARQQPALQKTLGPHE